MTDSRKCAKGLHWMTDDNTIIERQYNGTGGGITYKCRACRKAARRAHAKEIRPELTEKWKPMQASAQERGLDTGDPRHGTSSGYVYWGCRCQECRDAKNTETRVRRLRAKAKELGIKVPDRRMVRSVSSLDARAEAAFGMDRVLVGSVWDDPVFDAVSDLAAMGGL